MRSAISALGHSGLSSGSGHFLSHAHFSASFGARDFSSICTTYLPSTGKNLNPWNEPQVAMYRPFEAGCGEIMKSPLVVKASLYRSVSELVRYVVRATPRGHKA